MREIDSCCVFLLLCSTEDTVIVSERLNEIRQNFWDDPAEEILRSPGFSLFSIGEDVLLGRVAMKIEQKCHLMFLLDINYVILNCLDLREKLQVRSMEIAIKVLS